MSYLDSEAYVKTCPLCGAKLDIDDIDYSFKGKQDEYSICNACHYDFRFYIRYGSLWKYDKTPLKYHEACNDFVEAGWYADGQPTETVYVYKK